MTDCQSFCLVWEPVRYQFFAFLHFPETTMSSGIRSWISVLMPVQGNASIFDDVDVTSTMLMVFAKSHFFYLFCRVLNFFILGMFSFLSLNNFLCQFQQIWFLLVCLFTPTRKTTKLTNSFWWNWMEKNTRMRKT